ncbi:MAG: Hemolysin-type calcium-binding repeat (2 copies) [Rhodobacteraceae bacterium HLUCCA12]|nr:MAG: Hemolysin-type calcium-binding repeat (2 copies) [Rhodobacteraceae bacterium HLUCCA12]
MRLYRQGVVGSGVDLLDDGIRDIAAHVEGDDVHVYTTTGRNGGLVGYRIEAGGVVSAEITVIFPPNMTAAVGERLVLGDHGSGPVLFVGATSQGLIGYAIGDQGALAENAPLDWTDAMEAASNGGRGIVEAWVVQATNPLTLFPDEYAQDQIVSLTHVTINGLEYVLAADSCADAVTAFRRDSATGRLSESDSMGMREGLGIQAPTAMEVVQIGDQTFVIVGASGTSSLSVMRLSADGTLTPTDHLIDTGATRFSGIQAMTTATAGDHTFVIAGGADNGLSVFMLLPDGRLVHLETLAGDDGVGMGNVAALQAQVSGDVLHLFAGTQNGGGMAHYTISLDELGVQRIGSGHGAQTLRGTGGHDILIAASSGDTLDGGAGDDVLVSGPGDSRMRGGAGRDTFVVGHGGGPVHVLDFERRGDRLDLSDWPMLRDIAQLEITSTATGARIEYRGNVIILTSADGAPLSVDDLFPNGLLGPDRVPYIRADNTPPPEIDDQEPAPGEGRTIIGTGDGDSLRGGAGDDTIWGLSGDDTIHVPDGDNMIGAGPGNDTVRGGAGHDTIWGGPGDDLMYGGTDGRNVIWAGAGSDTAYGGGGDDSIGGGGGPDLIHGGAGNDRIWGGNGNDTLNGGDGDDTLDAGPGRDSLTGGGGGDTFVFFRNDDLNRITDFDPDEGDALLLTMSLWRRFGDLTPQEVVDRFAAVSARGDIVLDFGPGANTIITLIGYSDLDTLSYAIQIA